MTLHCTVETPHHWAITDRSGKVQQQGTVETLQSLPKHEPLVLIVPGEHVCIHHLQLPTRNRKRLLQAIPNMLEEQLAADIDTLHFALLDWQYGDQATVAVVARNLLSEWLERCSEAGLIPQQVIPDFLCLPRHPQTTVTIAQLEGDWLLLREDEFSGYALDLEGLNYWLQARKEEQPSLAVNDNKLSQHLIERGMEEVSEWPFGKQVSDWLGQGPLSTANLLQGTFSQQQPYKEAANHWLKAALGVILLLAILKLGSDGYEYSTLKHMQGQLHEAVTELLKKNFPEIKKIVKPKVQLQRELAALGGSVSQSNFLLFLNVIGQQKEQLDFTIDAIDYQKGNLTLSLTIKNFSKLQQLKKRLAADRRITSKELTSSSTDNQVHAQLRLSQVNI